MIDWYTAATPDGHKVSIALDGDDFVVFESGAIFVCMDEKTRHMLPQNAKGRSQAVQSMLTR